ncbi:MAG: hypothetical protein HYX45_10295 [Burkholderiales bacterium]|nr:hypothetical protein [Burkholderiales bacterium]
MDGKWCEHGLRVRQSALSGFEFRNGRGIVACRHESACGETRLDSGDKATGLADGLFCRRPVLENLCLDVGKALDPKLVQQRPVLLAQGLIGGALYTFSCWKRR